MGTAVKSVAGVVVAGASLSLLVLGSGCLRPQAVPVNGNATLFSGTADPCRGMKFDADNPDLHCIHHSSGEHLPAPDGLRIALAAAPVARSGYDAGLVVEMTNTTAAPLAVDVDDSCGTFEGQASNASSNSFESDCFGVCAGETEPRVVRVMLEPGGVVTKRVKFFAVQTRVVLDSHEECVTKTVGGLPPGAYDLRVTLPWTDPIPDKPTVTRPRVLEAQLTVTE
jgi:hypothetical protein